MPLDAFWHGDMRLLEVYQKAYLRNISYKAWCNGNYAMLGNSLVVANMSTKKGEELKEYPQWKDPIEQIVDKPKITKENLEQEFRKQQVSQNDWLRNILKKQ